MSKTTQGEFLKKLDEAFNFGYTDPAFIHDIHVIIGGEDKIAEAKSQILSAIRESMPKQWTAEHRIPSNGSISDEKHGYNKALTEVERQLLEE